MRTSGIPVDHTKLLRLLDYIARGLVWYHFKARVTVGDEVNVWPLWSHNAAAFDGIISRNAAQRVAANLGDKFVHDQYSGGGALLLGERQRPGRSCQQLIT